MDLEAVLDEISYEPFDFLTLFTHPESGGPSRATDITRRDSAWAKTVPHVNLNGRCLTYDPPFQSNPGKW